MNENNFTALYKTWETDKLLDIVDNPNDYQPLAVEMARRELNSRQLTQEQIAEAKAEQDLRRQGKANQRPMVRDIEDKFKSVGSMLGDIFNPIQKDTPTTDKFVKLISLFIGGLFLYQLYKKLGMLKFMFTGDGGRWGGDMVLYFAPFVILPIAGLLFWLRRKIGWGLVVIYFSYTAVGVISLLLKVVNHKSTGVPALDTLFPSTSPIVYLGSLLLFGGLAWALCKENMRKVYQVDKKFMLISLAVGTLIALLMTI